jgi:hypothetical protein
MDTPDKEVQTPVIDQLVKEGVELDRHYVHKVSVWATAIPQCTIPCERACV